MSTPTIKRQLKPLFTTLSDGESLKLLRRNKIGRIAYSLHDRVEIVPLHYVLRDNWIYGRTSPGGKLETLRHNQWIAFEVDEIDSLFEWRSVVVHGQFYHLQPGFPQHAKWEEALEMVRTIVPETFTEEDPVEHRTELFRIWIGEVSGRMAALQPDN